ncbi:hypothetical protein BGZ63DRAFT_488712 [Mariannaea sp. PMI_226]|nr:hypothetical protein BGZ63DRAFT_488712 [Mariannaea sp. PMI_226]
MCKALTIVAFVCFPDPLAILTSELDASDTLKGLTWPKARVANIENITVFLGPTSTWTFCRRAFTLLENAPNSPDTPRAPLNLDGAAFRLRWQSKPSADASDLAKLPALDYALFVYNTVKFRLGELFCIVDEARFFRVFDEFHKQPLPTAQTHNLWFVEYLLILAFGKAFMSSPSLTPDSPPVPPGSDLAARALSLLPDVAFLQDDRPALLAIEVLSLAALYFHAIDMRSPAYQYIGQALRLSLHDGLHCRVSDEVVGPDLAARCSNTWWAMYVLDQEITAGLGCPPAVPQNSITAPLPVVFSSSVSAKALTLRTRLSRLVSSISNFSCGFDDDPAQDFVKNTTAVLHSLAELSRDLDEVTSSFKAGGGELPQMFYNITISHHHCIVLATRPLVMWLLFRSISSSQPNAGWRAGPIATLLETSVRSATTMLLMLMDLAGRDMLETFLQSQLEYAFSSAMLLSILSVFLPVYVPSQEWRQAVSIVFEKMAMKGNVVVGLRRAELEHLETLLEPHRHILSLAAQSESNQQTGPNDPRAQAFQDFVASHVNGGLEQNTGINGWNDSHGEFDLFATDAADILALAQEFEQGDLSTSFIFDLPGPDHVLQ